MKAPLRAITTIVDWLVTDYTDKLDDEGKSFLSLLDNRANRMHDLIDGILRYSKAGRDNKDAEMVNTVYLVNDLCQMLIIPDNINVEVDENLPTFEIDKVQLEQVFQNLISNAIKFIDKEHGLITVKYIKMKSSISLL